MPNDKAVCKRVAQMVGRTSTTVSPASSHAGTDFGKATSHSSIFILRTGAVHIEKNLTLSIAATVRLLPPQSFQALASQST
jgi:hypothetical protein